MRGSHQWMTGMLLTVALLAAGCSGAGESPAQPTAVTNTSTRVISIPTFSFTQPTAPPQVATAAATIASATEDATMIDQEAVERGRTRYEALGCAGCHGANGEGTDQGSPLVEYTASQPDFVTLMRSGGSLGTSHQYASNRLSETGAANLYQYLRSLQNP